MTDGSLNRVKAEKPYFLKQRVHVSQHTHPVQSCISLHKLLTKYL